MRLLPAIPAVFMLGLSLLIWFGTSNLTYWDGVTPGAGFFPFWLASAGALLAAILLFQQFRGHSFGDLDFPDRGGFLRVAASVAAMTVMGLITPIVGMVPAVGLFMIFMLLVVLKQKLLPSVFATVVMAGGIELIFVRWLGVSLPTFALLG